MNYKCSNENIFCRKSWCPILTDTAAWGKDQLKKEYLDNIYFKKILERWRSFSRTNRYISKKTAANQLASQNLVECLRATTTKQCEEEQNIIILYFFRKIFDETNIKSTHFWRVSFANYQSWPVFIRHLRILENPSMSEL